MIVYIQQLANDIAEHLSTRSIRPREEIDSLLLVIHEEISRLQPDDFSPRVRDGFIERRRQLGSLCLVQPVSSRTTQVDPDKLNEAAEVCLALGTLLDAYDGRTTISLLRSFAFLNSEYLRTTCESSYCALSLTLLPTGAWTSVIVKSGEILEGVLFDRLTQNPATTARAMASPAAPKKRGKGIKDITKDAPADEWRFVDLLDVAAEIGIIPSHRAVSIDRVLRDYHKFTRLRDEVGREGVRWKAEAIRAKGTLDGICDYLDPEGKEESAAGEH